MNLSLVLQMAADAEPERIGLVCDGRRWSYAALLGAARGAAAAIQGSGCAYVALLDESSEAAAIALFGAAIAGVPYVPLNYRLADADLAALLKRIAPASDPAAVSLPDRRSLETQISSLESESRKKIEGQIALISNQLAALQNLHLYWLECLSVTFARAPRPIPAS